MNLSRVQLGCVLILLLICALYYIVVYQFFPLFQ
jgi:hypothetical protein